METAVHGFESCGLWPCNRFKIRDDEYILIDEDNDVPLKSGASPICNGQGPEHKRTEEVDPQPSEAPLTCTPEKQLPCQTEER